MCKSSLHTLLGELPKVEHHIHIEGSLEPDLLFELAKNNSIHLPTDDDAFTSKDSLLKRYRNFTSLDDFLRYYYIGMSVLITSNDFEKLANAYFLKAHNDNVKHVEIFFDPQAHLSRGISYSTVLEGLLDAKAKAQTKYGMSIEVILCFLRHLPVSDCLDVFNHSDVQDSFKSKEIIGIGLDSSELDFPPDLFVDIYSKTDQFDLRRTAHAGEEGPSDYIKSALDNLNVQRIDHGIRLIEDKDLMKKVAKDGILLSICPLSNVVLRCVKSIGDLPIREFLGNDVKFSINSDDPAYFGGYVLDNYCAIQDAFDLTVQDWYKICRNSINSSWTSDSRKMELSKMLDSVITSWNELND